MDKDELVAADEYDEDQNVQDNENNPYIAFAYTKTALNPVTNTFIPFTECPYGCA